LNNAKIGTKKRAKFTAEQRPCPFTVLARCCRALPFSIASSSLHSNSKQDTFQKSVVFLIEQC
jgi:hypothetical protein